MSQTQQNGWRACKNYLIIFAAFVATLSPLFNVYEARAEDTGDFVDTTAILEDEEEQDGEDAINTDITDLLASPMMASLSLELDVNLNANTSNRGVERREQNRRNESGKRVDNDRRTTNNDRKNRRTDPEVPAPTCETDPTLEGCTPNPEPTCDDDSTLDGCEEEQFVNILSVDYSTKKRTRSVKVTITIEDHGATIDETWDCVDSALEAVTICTKRYKENVNESVTVSQEGKTSAETDVIIRNIKKQNKNTPKVEIIGFDESGIYGAACNASSVVVTIRTLGIFQYFFDEEDEADCKDWSISFTDEEVELVTGRRYKAVAQSFNNETGKESKKDFAKYIAVEIEEPTCETDATLCEPEEKKVEEVITYTAPVYYNPTATDDETEETGDINGDGTTNEPEEEEEAAASWALLNLISAAIAAVLAIGASIRRMKNKVGLRVSGVLLGIASIVIFLATQDMSLPMAFTDGWSVLMVLLALANIAVFASLFRGVEEAKEETETSKK